MAKQQDVNGAPLLPGQSVPLSEMTDRMLLEEIAASQRRTEALVAQFVQSIGSNPMFKMMAGKLGM